MNQNRVAEILGTDGLLGKAISDFTPRNIQLQMAEAIEKTLVQSEILIAEAGTGTGKTFAYLVPALLSGARVIISTGTKHLQEQLYYRDLPRLCQALHRPVKMALLKGRANYLCWQRLDRFSYAATVDVKTRIQLHSIYSWAKQSSQGDIAEFSALTEDAPAWQYATSTVDNCLGQECEFLNQCFLLKARRLALEADILVINHHLFFADAALRDTGFGELLPGSNAIIFDEAHQLPEIASDYFGSMLSSRQFIELIRDTLLEQMHDAADADQLKQHALDLEQIISQMRQAFPAQDHKGIWSHIRYKLQMQQAIDDLSSKMALLMECLAVHASRSQGLRSCYERCQNLLAQLNQLIKTDQPEEIHWYEVKQKYFRLHKTPMDVAKPFQELMQSQKRAWIFTSATLTVDHSFQHFLQHLGIEKAKTLQLDSPYDYQHQSLLYLPENIPNPDHENFTQSVVTAALPVLKASEGRAFFLFTSHRALQEAAGYLSQQLSYPLLVQGQAPKRLLLEKFSQLDNAVLLGTTSFWEGIDVKGKSLSCVIIEKLPFAMMDDPVLKSRAQLIRKLGHDPFHYYQLPRAVIMLKQGVGRLIRDSKDRGVLMIGDPRITQRDYGKIFLQSLPPIPITHSLSDVENFFTEQVSYEDSCT
jgi:ATP-dependent DNA helicase DinG